MFGIKKRGSHEFLEMLLIAIFFSSSQAIDTMHLPADHLFIDSNDSIAEGPVDFFS